MRQEVRESPKLPRASIQGTRYRGATSAVSAVWGEVRVPTGVNQAYEESACKLNQTMKG